MQCMESDCVALECMVLDFMAVSACMHIHATHICNECIVPAQEEID